MSLGYPTNSPYDVRFHAAGYPVRISPWFWVVGAVLWWQDGDLSFTLVGIVVTLVSILLHEYGHGLTARALGCQPNEIVMYTFGGVCSYFPNRQLNRGGRLAILLAGPAVNFVLWGLALFALASMGNPTIGDLQGHPRWLVMFLKIGEWANFFWGLFNLLPILPLDGGQIALELFGLGSPYRARSRALVLSVVTASIWIAYVFSQGGGLGLGLVLPALLLFENAREWNALKASGGNDWSGGGRW